MSLLGAGLPRRVPRRHVAVAAGPSWMARSDHEREGVARGQVVFVEEEIDNTSVYIATASIGIFILVSVLFAGLVIRRRRRLADIDLIDSWGVFGSDSEELEDEGLES